MIKASIRKTNKAGVDLIKKYEGFRDKAYLCPAKVWTVGYGHTLGVKEGDTVTPQEAELMLREDLAAAENSVAFLVDRPLNDNQFAALVSLVFNIGFIAFKRSGLRKALNEGNDAEAKRRWLLWNKANGATLNGLTKRRQEEIELYDKKA